MDPCDSAGCEGVCTITDNVPVCSCLSGYTLTDNTTCSDVNECLMDNGDCDQVCLNVRGYFYCDCYQGYWLAADGRTCRANIMRDPYHYSTA